VTAPGRQKHRKKPRHAALPSTAIVDNTHPQWWLKKSQESWKLLAIAFHPGGTQLAYHLDIGKELRTWDVKRKDHHAHRNAPVTSVLSFDRSGKKLWAILDGDADGRKPPVGSNPDEVVSLTWPDLTEVSRWSKLESKQRARLGELTCVQAGDRWVLTGAREGSTKLLRTSDGQLAKEWPSPGGPVHCVALSPDETLAVSGTQQGIVQVVRVPSGELGAELSAQADSVESVAFRPDGCLLATAGKDKKVRLWQREGDDFRELLSLPAAGPVVQVAFSPDGTKLAMLVHNERAIRLWHLDRLFERLEKMGLGWERHNK
jgi:hypothetical protein